MGMKVKIQGKEYDIEQGMSKVSLTTLFELKSSYGIGMQTLMKTGERFGKIKDNTEILEDLELLNAFRVMVWLARKAAGEKLTLDEANDFPLDTFEFVSDEPEDADPKAEPAPESSAVANRATRRKAAAGKNT
jgi:hypothetical protein